PSAFIYSTEQIICDRIKHLHKKEGDHIPHNTCIYPLKIFQEKQVLYDLEFSKRKHSCHKIYQKVYSSPNTQNDINPRNSGKVFFPGKCCRLMHQGSRDHHKTGNSSP